MLMVWHAAPASAEPLYDRPVYNPETSSYFELVKVVPGYSIRGRDVPAVTWHKASSLAHARVYKGARGRLAVIRSRAASDFLRQTFKPDVPAWIGLRYWCEFNKLQWVTGEIHPRTEFANWDRIWRHDGGERGGKRAPACSNTLRFWPVNTWSARDGFRWNANGTNKEFGAFFIEYPTGEE